MLREWEWAGSRCSVQSHQWTWYGRTHDTYVNESTIYFPFFISFILRCWSGMTKSFQYFPEMYSSLIVWWHTTTVRYLVRNAFSASFMHTRTVFCDRNIILYRNRAYASLLSLADFHFVPAYAINHTVQQVQGSGGHAARTTRRIKIKTNHRDPLRPGQRQRQIYFVQQIFVGVKWIVKRSENKKWYTIKAWEIGTHMATRNLFINIRR